MGKMGPLLVVTFQLQPFFHFHDYGRKSRMCTEHGAFPSLESWGVDTRLVDGRVNFCWFVDIERWIRSSVPLPLKSCLVIGRQLRSLPLGFNQHLSRGKKGPFSIAIFFKKMQKDIQTSQQLFAACSYPPL